MGVCPKKTRARNKKIKKAADNLIALLYQLRKTSSPKVTNKIRLGNGVYRALQRIDYELGHFDIVGIDFLLQGKEQKDSELYTETSDNYNKVHRTFPYDHSGSFNFTQGK